MQTSSDLYQQKVHPTLIAYLEGVHAENALVPVIVTKVPRFAVPLWMPRATFVSHLTMHYALKLTSQQIRALAEHGSSERIELDKIVHTRLSDSAPLIGAPQVWAQGDTGVGIKVAVVDTGIDDTHPDLQGRVIASKDFTGSGSTEDGFGHSTHVASIIGGTGAASGGKCRGIAPGVSFLNARVLDSSGSGSDSWVMEGVQWSVDNGAQIINLSLGSDGQNDGTDALSQLCDAAVAKGVIVCVAAGNAGPGAGTVGSPGSAKNVITIGATSKSDQLESFSSRGPTLDNRIKPNLCFPGGNIVAARAAGRSMGTPVDNFYTSASGTSMANPHAAGTCALLLAKYPGSTPAQILDLLERTVKHLPGSANDIGEALGRGDAFAAFQLGPVSPPPPPPPPVKPPSIWDACLPKAVAMVAVLIALIVALVACLGDPAPTPAPGITVTPAGGVTVPAPITPSGCTVGDQIPYVYHDYRLVVQATCIVVIGRVEAVRGEADGDRHVMVRLNSQYQQYINTGNTAHQSGDLVVEPVCFSVPTQADAIDPCRIDPDPIRTLPNVGDCAQFEGRYVLDTTHFSWAEIHPLGKWTPSNACSAALRSLEQLHFEDPQDD